VSREGEARRAIAVRSAGRDWSFLVDDAATADEVLWHFGAWASVGARPSDSAGTFRLVSCDDAGGEAGARATADGLAITGPSWDLTASGPPDAQRIEVRHRRGSAVIAAATALRSMTMRCAFSTGRVLLHASSVRTSRGVIVFTGPSGAGKSTAAATFGEGDRLDEDLAVLARSDGRWLRLDVPDRSRPGALPPVGAALPVRAVLFPAAGAAFALTTANDAGAVTRCLHVPWFVNALPVDEAAESTARMLAGAARLVADVPCAEMVWRLGDDVPGLLARELP